MSSSKSRTVLGTTGELPVTVDEIGGIAIDTNVYERLGFRFRVPPLATIKLLDVQVLVPEVWRRETEQHLRASVEKVFPSRRWFARVGEWGTEVQMQAARVFESTIREDGPAKVAERMLDEHYAAIRAQQLQTDWSSGPSVLSDYFEARWPFEPSGDKKHEFPDAFALATLTHWAGRHQKRVLVVTGDRGCLAACAMSPHLVGVKNLVDAIRTLRAVSEAKRAIVAKYESTLCELLALENSELRRSIEPALKRAIEDLEVDISSDTDHDVHYDWEVISVDVVEIYTAAFGKIDIKVLNASAHELIFAWNIEVEVEVAAAFYRTTRGHGASASPHDAPTVEQSDRIDIEAIVTLQTGPPLSVPALEFASVRRVDIASASFSIDFGTIDPWESPFEE